MINDHFILVLISLLRPVTQVVLNTRLHTAQVGNYETKELHKENFQLAIYTLGKTCSGKHWEPSQVQREDKTGE